MYGYRSCKKYLCSEYGIWSVELLVFDHHHDRHYAPTSYTSHKMQCSVLYCIARMQVKLHCTAQSQRRTEVVHMPAKMPNYVAEE